MNTNLHEYIPSVSKYGALKKEKKDVRVRETSGLEINILGGMGFCMQPTKNLVQHLEVEGAIAGNFTK